MDHIVKDYKPFNDSGDSNLINITIRYPETTENKPFNDFLDDTLKDLDSDVRCIFLKMKLGYWSVLDTLSILSDINYNTRNDSSDTLLQQHNKYFHFSKLEIENKLYDIMDFCAIYPENKMLWPNYLWKKHIWFHLGRYIQACEEYGLIEKQKRTLNFWPFTRIIKDKYKLTNKGLIFEQIRFFLMKGGRTDPEVFTLFERF